jgi:hypothetical protein
LIAWPSIIQDIQRAKYRLIDIAVECGSTESTICDLLYGRTKDPRHALGSALMAMHARVHVPREYGNSAVDN